MGWDKPVRDSYSIDLGNPKWGIDCTGGKDAGDAINNALLKAYNQGIRVVYAPAGTYILEEPIRPLPYMTLQGVGKRATIFKVKAGTDINAIENNQVLYKARLKDFSIDGNKANNSFSNGGIALKMYMDSSLIENVSTFNVAKNALTLNWEGTISEDQRYLNKIFHCDFEDSGEEGVKWGWRTTDSWFCFNNVGSAGANLSIEGGTLRAIGNHFDGSPEYNILIRNAASWLKFSQNIFEAAQKHSIYFRVPDYDTTAKHISLCDNIIRNCGSSGAGYDLVHIEGYSATSKNAGIDINSNAILVDNGSFQARNGIYLSNCDRVSIVGNEFSGFTDANPVGVSGTTVTNIEVLGNGGKNGITTY